MSHSLRILLSIHHELDPDSGAPGSTVALGKAYANLGHEVRLLSFDDLPGHLPHRAAAMAYPPFVAMRLAREARRGIDVIDASTGDTWVWAALTRGRRRPLLVTRSHGLEHLFPRTHSGIRPAGAGASQLALPALLGKVAIDGGAADPPCLGPRLCAQRRRARLRHRPAGRRRRASSAHRQWPSRQPARLSWRSQRDRGPFLSRLCWRVPNHEGSRVRIACARGGDEHPSRFDRLVHRHGSASSRGPRGLPALCTRGSRRSSDTSAAISPVCSRVTASFSSQPLGGLRPHVHRGDGLRPRSHRDGRSRHEPDCQVGAERAAGAAGRCPSTRMGAKQAARRPESFAPAPDERTKRGTWLFMGSRQWRTGRGLPRCAGAAACCGGRCVENPAKLGLSWCHEQRRMGSGERSRSVRLS